MALNKIGHKRNLPEKNKNSREPFPEAADCVLVGEISVGKRRVPNKFDTINVEFKSFGPYHARNIGLGKLKRLTRRAMKAAQATNVALRSVYVKNGEFMIPLEPEFTNRNILYVKSSRKAFGEVVWLKSKESYRTVTAAKAA